VETKTSIIMKLNKRSSWLWYVLFLPLMAQSSPQSLRACKRECPAVIKKNGKTKPANFFMDVLHDIGSLYRNVIDWDTYKTIVATFPVCVATGMIDQSVHEVFYDKRRHKNINGIPSGLVFFADNIVVPLEATCAAAAFLFSSNTRLRETSKMFMIGLPFVIWTADIIKAIVKTDCCYRPLHEHLSKNRKQCFGGFPSTHAAQVSFAATLFGSQFGAKAAIPASILGALVVVPFIIDNRHYVSQISAGVGLGVLYGLAASKVVDKNFDSLCKLSLGVTPQGNPAITFAYNF